MFNRKGLIFPKGFQLPPQLGQQDVGHAFVANRTAKGSVGRISAFFAETKAPLNVANLECLPFGT